MPVPVHKTNMKFYSIMLLIFNIFQMKILLLWNKYHFQIYSRILCIIYKIKIYLRKAKYMIIPRRHFHHYSTNNEKYRELYCYRNKILWAVLSGRYWLGYKNTDEHDFTIRVLSISCFISLRPSCLWRTHFMNTNRKSLSIHNRQSSHRGIKHMYNMYYK